VGAIHELLDCIRGFRVPSYNSGRSAHTRRSGGAKPQRILLQCRLQYRFTEKSVIRLFLLWGEESADRIFAKFWRFYQLQADAVRYDFDGTQHGQKPHQCAIKTYGGRYVFADIDQFDVQLTTRVNWILSPKMSLQVYAQPFISVGRYWDYKEFAQPSTYSFQRYGKEIGTIDFDPSKSQYTVDPDGGGPAPAIKFNDPSFNDKFLVVNAIFRWEWRLGSTLYFVWTENRLDQSNPGMFSPGRDVGKLFTAHPNDIFLVRLAYWSTK
jgi:hypothetical protein